MTVTRRSLQKSRTPTADDRSACLRRSRPACASPRMQSRGVARPDDCIGQWRSQRPGVARRTRVSEERSVGAPQGARSTTKRWPARARFGASPLAAGLAPESCASFSESGIESLVRPGGWRRLRLFAGSTGASNVAFRGITPDPTTAIQAVAGSGVDAGQVGGLAQSTKTDLLNVGRQ
jgi:hypothetical protein